MRVAVLLLLASLFIGAAGAAGYDEIVYKEAGPISPGNGFSFTPLAKTAICRDLFIAGSFTGDSLRWYVDWSWDGNTFWSHDSATVVSGSDVWSRLVVTKTVGAATYSLDRVLWPIVRVRVKNASAVDELTNIELRLGCGQ